MMNPTSQLPKIALKKRASHPSSTREPDIGFRKLIDRLKQAKITIKLEKTVNLELQKVNNVEITTSGINNIQSKALIMN